MTSEKGVSSRERASPTERARLEQISSFVGPLSTIVMCATMDWQQDTTCVDASALLDLSFYVMAQVTSIILVKAIFLRESNRSAALSSYLEKLIIMQILEKITSIVVIGITLVFNFAKPQFVLGLSADVSCVVLGAYVLWSYFGWNSVTTLIAHYEVLILLVILYVGTCIKWMQMKADDPRKSPHVALKNPVPAFLAWSITETGDLLEVCSFMSGVWDLARPHLFGTEGRKSSPKGSSQFFRMQILYSWLWLLSFFFIEDLLRPIWEGETRLCNNRPVMITHEIHFFMCVDLAVFYLHQTYMPAQEMQGTEMTSMSA